jgi:voltage-gated potassium channel
MSPRSDQPQPQPSKRWFESLAQLVVVYSVAMLFLESELNASGGATRSETFWIWNERILLGLFTVEYLLRWLTAKDRTRHPFTLLAFIDLLAVAPSLVGLALDLRSLKMLRTLQMLWVFKLYRYHGALALVITGFRRVKHELAVVGLVAVIVVLCSSVAMHGFEHAAQPEKFARLSDALWWSFVTLSTVGYGDIYPVTFGGRVVAVITMILGTGIFGTFISLIGSSFLASMRNPGEPQATLPFEGYYPPDERLEVLWAERSDRASAA